MFWWRGASARPHFCAPGLNMNTKNSVSALRMKTSDCYIAEVPPTENVSAKKLLLKHNKEYIKARNFLSLYLNERHFLSVSHWFFLKLAEALITSFIEFWTYLAIKTKCVDLYATRKRNSESFDAVLSGKDAVSASLRFKQPGWLSTDMPQPSVEEYNWKDGCRGERYWGSDVMNGI